MANVHRGEWAGWAKKIKGLGPLQGLGPLRRILLVAIALTGPLALGSCQPKSPGRDSQIVLSTLSDPKTFNYANNTTFPSIFLFAYEGLLRENAKGEILPSLAESWQYSADKKRITFTLRPNLRWSDGKPLTAADVVFTYRDVIFNPEVPTDMKDQMRIGVEGKYPTVKQLDQRRVEFTLPEPFAPFLRAQTGAQTGGVVILPQHALAQSLKTKSRDGNLAFLSTWGTDTPPDQIVGNGPYVIDRYTAGQRLVFRRNPHYWRKDAQGQQLPYIDRIVWQFIENTDTQLLRFRSGELDVMGDARPLRPEYVSLLKREEQRGQFKVLSGGPWSGTLYLSFNQNAARKADGQPVVDPVKQRWFSHLPFRQAVAYGINRDRMNTNIFRGLGVVQNSPITLQSPYFSDRVPVYNYNLPKAKQLLQSAGFRYNEQGQLLDAQGNRVRFSLLTNAGNKVREALGAQIKQDLAALGMQVDFTPIAFNTLVERISTNRTWDAYILGETGGVDPHGGANIWMSQGAAHYFNLGPQTGQPPIQGWQLQPYEREIDRLMIAGARELDDTKRKAIYAQFQQVTQTHLPVIYLVNDSAVMVVRDRLQGVDYSGLPSWGLWNIAELKLESKLENKLKKQ